MNAYSLSVNREIVWMFTNTATADQHVHKFQTNS